MINVGSVLNPSRRCSSNVMLGKSFEDIPDFLSSFNRLRNSFLSASNLVLEFFDISFCNVIFVLLSLFILFRIIIIIVDASLLQGLSSFLKLLFTFDDSSAALSRLLMSVLYRFRAFSPRSMSDSVCLLSISPTSFLPLNTCRISLTLPPILSWSSLMYLSVMSFSFSLLYLSFSASSSSAGSFLNTVRSKSVNW